MSGLALDPLIAEAKRRARLRRLLVAALGIAAVAAAVMGVVRDSERTRPAVVSAPTCRPAQLRLLKPAVNGAYTGHVVMTFAFANTSANACALRGWPRFEVAVASGRMAVAPVGHVRNATSSHVVPAGTVVLRPGGAASFHVIVEDLLLGERCGLRLPPPLVRTVVVPPGSTTPAHGSTRMSYCGKRQRLFASLSPVVSGRVDRYNPG